MTASPNPTRSLRITLADSELRLGVLTAQSVRCEPAGPGLLAELEQLEEALRRNPSGFDEEVRRQVRDLLRRGGYRPTGRGKPASEFLLSAVLEGRLARINNLVDACNFASLQRALPISIFDADLLGDDPSVRLARPGESYVFNPSGQRMDIAGLPVICRGPEQEPVGNAVKDSMLCKVHAGTRRVSAVVYASTRIADSYLRATLQELTRLFVNHAGAEQSAATLLP
jgi:DNA/RNA-binding domain of Phe-tRNA-synthetase-like protein